MRVCHSAGMDELDEQIQQAARKRERSRKAFLRDDGDVRRLLAEGRAAGKGPSHMARLTGFSREWVARIAPPPPADGG